jgi:hypothetical protein
LALALAWTGTAHGQVAPAAPEALSVGDWKLAPVLEARMRGEYRKDLDGKDRGLLTERVRLGAEVSRGAVEGRVVLQDARVWDLGTGGDMRAGPSPLASTGVYEAWGEAHTSGAQPSFVRVGRQGVTWGEGRLLGVSDWSPAGRSLDAVRGRLIAGDWRFELLAAVLEDPIGLTVSGTTTALGVTQAYGQLFGARGEWALDPLFGVELYGLARLAQSNPAASFDSTVRGSTYTGALRLGGEGHGWVWGAEGAYQIGKADGVATPAVVTSGGPREEQRAAWATAGHVAYTFEHVLLQPSVRLGGSYASGDDGGGTYRGFDPILPDAHVWYGAMDLLSWSNAIEGNARVSIVPWTDGVAAVEYRYMQLAQASGAWTGGYLTTIAQAPGNGSAQLGHEVDASIAWSPWVPVDLRVGYSALVLGDGAKALLGTVAFPAPSLSHYAYLQATLRVP